MAANDSNQIEEEFVEAKNNWELEKLYVDLASTKGKALTPVEKKFLRGLLCGCSPAEIASIVYQSRSSSTVRVYLSNGLYKYIEEMLSNQAGYSVKVKNWSRVTHLLEKAGYKKGRLQLQPTINVRKAQKEQETDLVKIRSIQIQDWGEAIDVGGFYGRTTELAKTQQWIVQERCRLLVLLGMGGIGKTAFSVKLAQEIQDEFEYVIWRSLRLAPSLEVILDRLIQILCPKIDTKITQTVDGKISQLIDCLRSSRCLIVLDHFDSILVSGENNGETEHFTTSTSLSIKNDSLSYLLSPIQYRKEYEIYGELIRRVGESQHQSCLVLTSREKTQEIASLEGKKLSVHSLKLTGLSKAEILLILEAKGFANISKEASQILFDWYAGNPLFIKLVATAIQELFGGNIDEFLKQDTVVFGDIRATLDEQFNRLSHLEKHMVYWLAVNQDAVSVRKLQENSIPGLSQRLSQRLILEAMELLQKRSLIESQASYFSLSPVLMEYALERLIEENFKFSKEKEENLLMSHTIFATQLKDYMEESHIEGGDSA
ncbi:NB-ARC domain-containing protein [Dendronalium sp. ChiSLP03b]|uniref:NB-ARC domain-containing protein n=1 Tax=Dendronalium sp. ChiSLP03b TaxID=3075381 RepID=UPI002AD490E5|nr:NB-ARC domain-containing protein [Dendronalium sp. ChiSLP03b]MDZ8208662.1 NB-ARC domain-containing protein [Dendronalium sp. ChiSLP03b]